MPGQPQKQRRRALALSAGNDHQQNDTSIHLDASSRPTNLRT
jgi:hypothetical protein